MLAPELLTYPGPVVCVDIKGEAYAVTARRRRELPNADLENDAQMISSRLAGGSSISKDPFWDISAGGLVSGLIVYLAHHRDQAHQLFQVSMKMKFSFENELVVLEISRDR